MFNLIQALQETRGLAEDHAGDPAWDELRARIDTVLDGLTFDEDDPTTPALGAQRIDRTVDIAPEQAELAAAALAAVHDRPEEQQLDLARAAVEDLADAID